DCLILSDALNHNSMIEGVRQSGCDNRIWRHNDVEHLEQLLRTVGAERPKLIVFETLYSMDGDVAPVHRICDLAARYGAMTYADEMHRRNIAIHGIEGLEHDQLRPLGTDRAQQLHEMLDIVVAPDP